MSYSKHTTDKIIFDIRRVVIILISIVSEYSESVGRILEFFLEVTNPFFLFILYITDTRWNTYFRNDSYVRRQT